VQFLFVSFSLQVENKPHDGVENRAFMLELAQSWTRGRNMLFVVDNPKNL
jgi:hypothetical protein